MTLYPEGTQKPSTSLKHPSTHLRATPSFYIRLFIKTANVNPSSELRQIVSFHLTGSIKETLHVCLEEILKR